MITPHLYLLYPAVQKRLELLLLLKKVWYFNFRQGRCAYFGGRGTDKIAWPSEGWLWHYTGEYCRNLSSTGYCTLTEALHSVELVGENLLNRKFHYF